MMRYAFFRYITGLSQATDQFIPHRLKYCTLRITHSLTPSPTHAYLSHTRLTHISSALTPRKIKAGFQERMFDP
jgi:hypothetical protein